MESFHSLRLIGTVWTVLVYVVFQIVTATASHPQAGHIVEWSNLERFLDNFYLTFEHKSRRRGHRQLPSEVSIFFGIENTTHKEVAEYSAQKAVAQCKVKGIHVDHDQLTKDLTSCSAGRNISDIAFANLTRTHMGVLRYIYKSVANNKHLSHAQEQFAMEHIARPFCSGLITGMTDCADSLKHRELAKVKQCESQNDKTHAEYLTIVANDFCRNDGAWIFDALEFRASHCSLEYDNQLKRAIILQCMQGHPQPQKKLREMIGLEFCSYTGKLGQCVLKTWSMIGCKGNSGPGDIVRKAFTDTHRFWSQQCQANSEGASTLIRVTPTSTPKSNQHRQHFQTIATPAPQVHDYSGNDLESLLKKHNIEFEFNPPSRSGNPVRPPDSDLLNFALEPEELAKGIVNQCQGKGVTGLNHERLEKELASCANVSKSLQDDTIEQLNTPNSTWRLNDISTTLENKLLLSSFQKSFLLDNFMRPACTALKSSLKECDDVVKYAELAKTEVCVTPNQKTNVEYMETITGDLCRNDGAWIFSFLDSKAVKCHDEFDDETKQNKILQCMLILEPLLLRQLTGPQWTFLELLDLDFCNFTGKFGKCILDMSIETACKRSPAPGETIRKAFADIQQFWSEKCDPKPNAHGRPRSWTSLSKACFRF